jgi:spore maturation protein A
MGIKAMQHLQELNEHKETASNSMCMVLALNTSSVQLLPPVTVIALLGVGASGLFVSIFLATLCSTVVAILAARWYANKASA